MGGLSCGSQVRANAHGNTKRKGGGPSALKSLNLSQGRDFTDPISRDSDCPMQTALWGATQELRHVCQACQSEKFQAKEIRSERSG